MRVKMKWVTGVLLAAVAFMPLTGSAYGDASIAEAKDISVYVEGFAKTFEDVPLVVNGRTMLPLRATLTSMGVPDDVEHIAWRSEDQTVKIVKGTTQISLRVGAADAYVNGQKMVLDAAPIIYSKNNRVYIPARFVAQALGNEVAWDKYLRRVYIRNAVQYKNVKNILDNAVSKMDAMGGYQVVVTQEPSDAPSISETKVNVESKVVYFKSAPAGAGAKPIYESYTIDREKYEKYTAEGTGAGSYDWTKTAEPDQWYGQAIRKTLWTELINPRDVVYAGLKVTEDRTAGKYILTGDVYPVTRYLELEGGFYTDPERKHKHGKLIVEISVATGQILRINEAFTYEYAGATHSRTADYLYTELSGEAKLIVPSDVLSASSL